MEKFKDVFYNWIDKKVNTQIVMIDKICEELDLDPKEWFNVFFKRDLGCYTGTEFLNEMLPNFIYYISREFEKPLYKYCQPKGYNIYKEPYLSLDLNLRYNLETGFLIKKQNKKEFKELMSTLKLNQKLDLMKNKLFSHIVLQTNLKIFSKNDIRVLKLKKLNYESDDRAIERVV